MSDNQVTPAGRMMHKVPIDLAKATLAAPSIDDGSAGWTTPGRIPDAAVESAAAAHHGILTGGGPAEWGYLDKQAQDNRLYWMRAALEAAAPHILAQGWDEGVAYVFEGGTEVSDENPYRPTP